MRFRYTRCFDRRGRFRPQRTVIDLAHPDPQDRMMREIERTRCFYEIDLLEYLGVRGPAGGVFLDVGANVGNHAVYFGRFLADRVIAVEPSPEARAGLARNLERNRVTNCTIVPCGAGARAGRALLVPPKKNHPHNLGATQLALADRPGEGDVDVTTLDAIADGDVTLVKIDVEGMELDVLEGAERLLEGQRPQLCVELATQQQYDRIAPYLAGRGYRPAGPFCATPTYVFTDPSVHEPRRSPPWWLYRAVSTVRRRVDSARLGATPPLRI